MQFYTSNQSHWPRKKKGKIRFIKGLYAYPWVNTNKDHWTRKRKDIWAFSPDIPVKDNKKT